jgi:peptidyl-prolyl cis-trans isomerase SurA
LPKYISPKYIMTKGLLGAALSLVVLFLPPLPARAGEILDRIVATVNGHIILQSDWDDALRFDACTSGRALRQLTADDRKRVLDGLIDQELLREQMGAADFQHSTEPEVAAKTSEIRRQYPAAATEAGWQQTLSQCGLTENGLRQRVAVELDVMRLVDAHLRPAIDIDAKSIESYYNQELLPQLRQSGSQQIPLATVTPEIKELLTQQKINQLLVAWLQNLRSGSQIRTEPASATGESQVQ